ncbi:hypothetical protein MMUC44124_28605 [Mycolicibacterium mucogenicum DSM 44124]|nr:hypothetical protein MMUC44124_28605 [Mycolicibacterium mucogenicum DSM 44124]
MPSPRDGAAGLAAATGSASLNSAPLSRNRAGVTGSQVKNAGQ